MAKDNELLTAVKQGNSQFIRKYLHKYRKSAKKNSSQKCQIKIKDTDGFSVLHHAALKGDVEMVMAIIEMEGDPNDKDKQGMTPVHLAAWAGKENTVKALLESNGLPNLSSLNGDTPLHLAAQHGYAGSVKVLLDNRADADARNENCESPLDLACQFGHTAVVRQLLNNENVTFHLMSPDNQNIEDKSPLHLAAKSGHSDIVHLLLQAGVDVNKTNLEGTALHVASLYGKKHVVELLLEAGADVHRGNGDGLIALDLVNRFTTSRAGLEIKQMLREAAGEKVTYATAVSDYHNQYDSSCLSFKSGDSVAIIEQNENGRWRGYLVNSENERVGYFPAMAVHLINQSRKSVGSNSSLASGDSSGTRSRTSTGANGEKRNTPSSPPQIPVGIVPIGNFDVVTLAQNDPENHAPPKQTASGTVPTRLNSFKKNKHRLQLFQSPPSDPAPPPSQSSPQAPPSTLVKQLQKSPRTTNAQKQLFQGQSPPPKAPTRSFSERSPPLQTQNSRETQTLGRRATSAKSSSEEFRARTVSSGVPQHELAKALTQGVITRQCDWNNRAMYPDSTSKNACEKNISDRDEFETVSNGGQLHNASNNESTSVQSTNKQNGIRSNGVIKGGRQSNLYENTMHTSHDNNNHPFILRTKSQDGSKSNYVNYAISDIDHLTFQHKIQMNDARTLNSEEFYENASSTHSSDEEAPRLPVKRSQTLPKSYVANLGKINSHNNSLNMSGSSVRHHHVSMRQRDNPGLYENTSIQLPGPGSPHSQITSGHRLSPDSTDGRFHFSSDQTMSQPEQELLNWLTELKLGCYFQTFQSQGFDIISVRAVTPEDLTLLEISKAGHRKKLLSELAKLLPTDQLPNEKPHDVGSWLGQLNLQQYETNFVEGGFDDIDFIKDLDRNDLEMIDIKKKGHQKKLLMAVQRLNELDLTEVLDIAVAESPIKRTYTDTETGSETREFFPAELILETTPAAMSTDKIVHGDPVVNPTLNGISGKKAPVPVPPKPTKAPPPAAKPKPKPAAVGDKVKAGLDGTVQGDQEEVVRSSKSRDFFKQVEQKAIHEENEISTDPIERRRSYTDRASPAVLSPRKMSVPVPASKPPRRSSSSSSDSSDNITQPPVVAKKAPPPAPPKRSGSLSENSSTAATTPVSDSVLHLPPTQESPEEQPQSCQSHVQDQAVHEPSPPLPTFKPPPPPAKTGEPDLELPPPAKTGEPDLELPPPAKTGEPDLELPPPPPLDELPSSLDSSLQEPSFSPPPPPPVEMDDLSIEDDFNASEDFNSAPATIPLVIEPITLPEIEDVDKEFAETDDIMDQLLNDLDDFTKDLDSMF